MFESGNLLYTDRGLNTPSRPVRRRIKKLIAVISLSGCLYATASCLPSRNQLNSTLSSGILSGIQLALTLGVTNLLSTVAASSTASGTASTG